MDTAKIPILLTRPAVSSDDLMDLLSEKTRSVLAPIRTPLIEIEGLGIEPDLSNVDAVIFTSSNGVRFAPDGNDCLAFCVGSRTTDLARQRGWAAIEAGEDADGLVQMLRRQEPGRFVHVAGRFRRGDIAERLSEYGHDVETCVAYEQRQLELTDEARAALASRPAPIVPLFSPRSASLFVEQIRENDCFIPVAFSRAVAGPVIGRGGRTLHIVPAPTLVEMARTIEKIAFGLAWVEGSSGAE